MFAPQYFCADYYKQSPQRRRERKEHREMRPAIYRAYHHITILGKENEPRNRIYDVTGSLCENNDKFATQRQLPEIEIGDIVVIHDTGAHGFSMGFNYNGKLRSAELLLKEDRTVEIIRRAETIEDYFATMIF
jgi:diaminopimelate decarboxylase